MRKIMWGVAAGAVLALAAATGVAAYWQAQVAIPIATVVSGDLSVTAQWVDGTPDWPAMYPGDTVEANIEVTVKGHGDTLAWQVDVESSTIDPAFLFQARNGSCNNGSALPATDSPDSLTICVRYTLDDDAADDLQGDTFNPLIAVSAEQVTS